MDTFQGPFLKKHYVMMIDLKKKTLSTLIIFSKLEFNLKFIGWTDRWVMRKMEGKREGRKGVRRGHVVIIVDGLVLTLGHITCHSLH